MIFDSIILKKRKNVGREGNNMANKLTLILFEKQKQFAMQETGCRRFNNDFLCFFFFLSEEERIELRISVPIFTLETRRTRRRWLAVESRE